MATSHAFGSVLSRIRAEEGFASAHAFYRSRQGRRNLGLSFANYLNLEKGRSLPKSSRVKPILAALGLAEGSAQARELVRAYLVSVLGSDELLRAAGLSEPAPSASLAGDAARQALTQRSAQFSLEQWQVLAGNRTAYDIHIFLVNTPGWVGIAEIGKAIGARTAELKNALKAMSAAGVIETTAGKARSPFARKQLRPAGFLEAAGSIHASLYKHRGAWVGRSKLAHLAHLTVRLAKPNLDRFLPHLTEAVNLSAVYGDAERTDDSAVYLIEGRVYNIFP